MPAIIGRYADDPLGESREQAVDPLPALYWTAFEAVRVASHRRGAGLGRRGCGVVQLTTDAGRPDAHRVYEALGFAATHVGMKPAWTQRGDDRYRMRG